MTEPTSFNRHVNLATTARLCVRLLKTHYGLDVTHLSSIEIDNIIDMLEIIQLQNFKRKEFR